MKILFTTSGLPFPFSLAGGAKELHQLLKGLSKLGHSVFALSGRAGRRGHIPTEKLSTLDIKSIHNDSGEWDIEFTNYCLQCVPNYMKRLELVIKKTKPDVIFIKVTGNPVGGNIVVLGKKYNIPSVMYVQSPPVSKEAIIVGARYGAKIVCNSPYLRDMVFRGLGTMPEVVYGPVEDCRVEYNPNGFITMVNPVIKKGINTFWHIAMRMPEEQFLLAESWLLGKMNLRIVKAHVRQIGNIKFMRRAHDVKDVYSQTKLLIIPSTWHESFSNLVREGQQSGIPAIASDRGSMRQNVGEGGLIVEDFLNPIPWVDTIRKVLSDQDLFNELRAGAIKEGKRQQLSTEYNVKKLEGILQV